MPQETLATFIASTAPITGGIPISGTALGILAIAALIVAFEVWDGWRNGLPRKLLGLGAIILGATLGWLGGPYLVPYLAGLIDWPDMFLRLAGSGAIFITVNLIAFIIAHVVIKPTGKVEGLGKRQLIGSGGALVGLLTGGVWVILLYTCLNIITTVGEATITFQEKSRDQSGDYLAPVGAEKEEDPFVLRAMTSLVEARKEIDALPGAEVMQQVNPIPEQYQRILEKSSQLLGDPEALKRFTEQPRSKLVLQHPKVQELLKDTEIQEMAQSMNVVGMLNHPKVKAVAEDPELTALIEDYDVEAAIDRALADNWF